MNFDVSEYLAHRYCIPCLIPQTWMSWLNLSVWNGVSMRFKYLIYINIFLNIADLLNLVRTIAKRVQKKNKYRKTSIFYLGQLYVAVQLSFVLRIVFPYKRVDLDAVVIMIYTVFWISRRSSIFKYLFMSFHVYCGARRFVCISVMWVFGDDAISTCSIFYVAETFCCGLSWLATWPLPKVELIWRVV